MGHGDGPGDWQRQRPVEAVVMRRRNDRKKRQTWWSRLAQQIWNENNILHTEGNCESSVMPILLLSCTETAVPMAPAGMPREMASQSGVANGVPLYGRGAHGQSRIQALLSRGSLVTIKHQGKRNKTPIRAGARRPKITAALQLSCSGIAVVDCRRLTYIAPCRQG
jgi:hypothetical protein